RSCTDRRAVSTCVGLACAVSLRSVSGGVGCCAASGTVEIDTARSAVKYRWTIRMEIAPPRSRIETLIEWIDRPPSWRSDSERRDPTLGDYCVSRSGLAEARLK